MPVADGAPQVAGQITRSIQCHCASVWCELVAFRAGEMQPGAGDTSSHQTEADATAFSTFRARDERAGNDGRRAGAKLARPPCQFPPVGPGGFIPEG